MRYVDLETFLKLPAGTVYMVADKHEGPVVYDLALPLHIKGDTLDGVNDWGEFELVELEGSTDSGKFGELMELMIDHGQSVPVDAEPVGSRHGMFPKQGEISFFVLDKEDTRRVIGLLQMALKWQEGE